MRRIPKIVIRSLHRESAYGLSTHPLFCEVIPKEPKIEIDTPTRGCKRMEIFLHEALHLAVPALPENVVLYAARYLAKVLWHAGYRADEEWQDGHFSNKDR